LPEHFRAKSNRKVVESELVKLKFSPQLTLVSSPFELRDHKILFDFVSPFPFGSVDGSFGNYKGGGKSDRQIFTPLALAE
jgi:hypothetical protein